MFILSFYSYFKNVGQFFFYKAFLQVHLQRGEEIKLMHAHKRGYLKVSKSKIGEYKYIFEKWIILQSVS